MPVDTKVILAVHRPYRSLFGMQTSPHAGKIIWVTQLGGIPGDRQQSEATKKPLKSFRLRVEPT